LALAEPDRTRSLVTSLTRPRFAHQCNELAKRLAGIAVLEYRLTETLPGPQRDVAEPARLCRPRRLASSPHWRKTRTFPGTKAKSGERRTVCWREPDSNHRSRRERDSRRERPPRPTIVVSRDDLRLMTPISLSVRHLSSATAARPFTRAGPMVRIRFPPAVSRQTIGSSARSRVCRCIDDSVDLPESCCRVVSDPRNARYTSPDRKTRTTLIINVRFQNG